MTKKDIDDIIKTICPNDEDFEKPCISPAYLKHELEALALEQEPCEQIEQAIWNIKRGKCIPHKRETLNTIINALEIVAEFEKAQIITGGRLNGRTYAYKCGLEDGKRKALEQENACKGVRK